MSESHYHDRGNEVTMIKRRSAEAEETPSPDPAVLLPFGDDDA
ncbi:MAG: hypothetical protein U0903_20080 [Planctomycetales bacterium]